MTVGSQVQGLLISLQSIDAILSSLAVKTEEREAREAFHQSALKTRTIIKEIQKERGKLNLKSPSIKKLRKEGLRCKGGLRLHFVVLLVFCYFSLSPDYL
ncbi:DUF1657 domain-containing protein [Halalkalibacter alkalisediminis]|uniref:DUF1657 domain-containing protein n=1 Tax=Halalkalibacter alkalisediminis TaxID=935616 RepID=UPI0036443085